MRIERVKIKNFRSYGDEVEIIFDDLTAFVGKNDAGKSTVLEALDIFFNCGKGVIKLDKDDVNKNLKSEGDLETVITVVFGQLPSSIVIDATNETTLENEYLLNEDGFLEVVKKYDNGKKEKVFIKALHPCNEVCNDLLLMKNADLKRLLNDLEIECKDKNVNAVMRESIWGSYSPEDLDLKLVEIEASKIDKGSIWDKIETHLPLYTLFQSDRKNTDGDSEIQDPLKLAAEQILNDPDLRRQLDLIAETVKGKLESISKATLQKLNEMNPDVAESLHPVIPPLESLKWHDVFKNVSIACDDDIPINKRGSGVKRLILLNFFRAEAERRMMEDDIPSVIYAIEEPETSQHLDHQRKLIEAFKVLSSTNNTQIVITTHSPSIVKVLDFGHVKLIKQGDKKEIVNVEKKDLPYPSLNEVNYLAFGEAGQEYHTELYGFIEGEGYLKSYEEGQDLIMYKRLSKGSMKTFHVSLSQYVRHQIHHPDNTLNVRFNHDQLQDSIRSMRKFIKNIDSH